MSDQPAKQQPAKSANPVNSARRSTPEGDNGPDNLAMLRRLALNIVRADESKGSLAGKIRKAAWNDGALINMLSQMR